MTAPLRFGRAEVRPSERQLLVDGRPVGLGARAFDVLLALVERRDRIVAKNELLDSVWPGLVVEENNLQVQISSLRRALGPQAIATIPGRGYRFTAALDDESVSQPGASALRSTSAPEATDARAAPLSNLPAELPPLYGRAADLSALRALIESHKLVTVAGAAGIGKTALAQALAHQLVGSDQLGALVDKSLVVADMGEAPRYRLLETSRAFAMEKVQQADETDAVRRSHAEAMLAVFEGSLEEEYVLPTQARLERYLPDLDNARGALDWSAGASGDAELQIALTGAIAWLWVSAGLRPEGMRRSRSAMARIAPSTAPQLAARLLGSWSRLAHPEVGPEELAADARAVELYRTLGDRRALFTVLCFQSRAQANCRRTEGAEVALHEAEQIFESTWPPALRIPMLTARCWLFMGQGRFEEGIGVGQELLQLTIALDDKRLTLTALIFLEQSTASLGRWEESVALGRDMAERIQRDRSLRSGIENVVFSNLSASLTALGEIDEALVMARRAYPAVEQAGRVMELLDPFALLAFKRGRIGDAARMVGRADMRYATSNVPRQPVEQTLHDMLVLALQGAMPPDELSRLMKEGEVLSDEVAVRLALRD